MYRRQTAGFRRGRLQLSVCLHHGRITCWRTAFSIFLLGLCHRWLLLLLRQWLFTAWFGSCGSFELHTCTKKHKNTKTQTMQIQTKRRSVRNSVQMTGVTPNTLTTSWNEKPRHQYCKAECEIRIVCIPWQFRHGAPRRVCRHSPSSQGAS